MFHFGFLFSFSSISQFTSLNSNAITPIPRFNNFFTCILALPRMPLFKSGTSGMGLNKEPNFFNLYFITKAWGNSPRCTIWLCGLTIQFPSYFCSNSRTLSTIKRKIFSVYFHLICFVRIVRNDFVYLFFSLFLLFSEVNFLRYLALEKSRFGDKIVFYFLPVNIFYMLSNSKCSFGFSIGINISIILCICILYMFIFVIP